MKNPAIINILGTQAADGEKEKIEFITDGSFAIRKNKLFIYYNENEASGYEGFTTTITAEPNNITLSRKGKYTTSLLLSKNERHLCHYQTDYGDMMLGVNTSDISLDFNENGGKLYVNYSLEYNNSTISKNSLSIKIKKVDLKNDQPDTIN